MEAIKQYLDELMDRSTPDRPVWNQEQLRAKQPAHWSYIDGCMAIAVLYMSEVSPDKKYFDFLENFISYFVREDGTILGYDKETYNADSINEGKVLFALYEKTGKEKYKRALDLLYSQVRTQKRIAVGNFWHKLIYPQQVWLDGLYMIQPFYVAYELDFNNGKNLADSMSQFANVDTLMKDPEMGLYYHGYDETKSMFWANPKTGCSASLWTRSIGWFAMALADTIEILGEDHPKERAALALQLQKLLDNLLKYQDPKSKLFYQMTVCGDKEGNYLETSGTCAIAYSLMKAARLGVGSDDYYDRGYEILENVVAQKLIKRDGEFVLKDICLVAGLGGDPGKGDYKLRDGSYAYYISEPKVENDAKGIGPLVYAYTEVLKHGKK